MKFARLCTQRNMAEKRIKMLKWEERKKGPNVIARNHHAAHVTIEIMSKDDKWNIVPGAWLIPTSAEANTASFGKTLAEAKKIDEAYYYLRKDLTGENSVTAIQLPKIRIQNQRNEQEKLLYDLSFEKYPTYESSSGGTAAAAAATAGGGGGGGSGTPITPVTTSKEQRGDKRKSDAL